MCVCESVGTPDQFRGVMEARIMVLTLCFTFCVRYTNIYDYKVIKSVCYHGNGEEQKKCVPCTICLYTLCTQIVLYY